MVHNIEPPKVDDDAKNQKIKTLVISEGTFDELFKRAVVSKNMQQLISDFPILPYLVKLPAKILQYEDEGLVINNSLFVRLPTSKEEQGRMLNENLYKIEEAILERYIYEEDGKLKIHNGNKSDLPNLKKIWSKAKKRPATINRFVYVATTFINGLFGRREKVRRVSLPFPLFRENFLNVFSGTKKEVHSIIQEELRNRYEMKRDISKVSPKIVLTPNLDHLRMLYVEKSAVHIEAYKKSWLQTADGAPPLIVFGKQSLGFQPKEQVTGVDLFMETINTIGQQNLPYTIYFLGGFGNVPYKTRDYFISVYPSLKDNFVGISTPPLGFLDDESKMKAICQDINKKKPDIIFVGMTNTTQERLALELVRRKINFGIVFGVGRSIELVSGYQKRPPVILKKLHLEWLHRFFTGNKGLGNIIYMKRVWEDFVFAFRTVFVD